METKVTVAFGINFRNLYAKYLRINGNQLTYKAKGKVFPPQALQALGDPEG